MRFSIKCHIDIPDTVAKVEDEKLWIFAANEYHKLLAPYVPKQSGALNDTKKITSGNSYGKIEYKSIYAHYIHEGRLMVDSGTGSSWAKKGHKKVYSGATLNLKHNKNPLASANWEKVAEPVQKPKLIKSMQDYVDRGRLKLND